MTHEPNLAEYTRFEFKDGAIERPVFRRGAGPAVIVIHELPGLHPLAIRFADRVAAAGMTVFCPSLFGDPGRALSPGYALGSMLKVLCVQREFNAWATDRSGPIVDWLRALARKAHAECGGRGVGAVGMCFTGGFALAMMTDPAMVAPVLSQPSQPFPISKRHAAAVGASSDDIECVKRRMEREDLRMIGLRFLRDPLVPQARFDSYKHTFGDRFEAIEIDPSQAQAYPPLRPHAVLTVHLRDEDPDGPTKRAETRVIQFLKQQTAAQQRDQVAGASR